MTHLDLLKRYNISNPMLHLLYDRISEYLTARGIRIRLTNLESVIETEVYADARSEQSVYTMDRANTDKHHETCICNGIEVFLHSELADVGGISGRLYDLLHIGAGHLWQWSAGADSGLQFYGDRAWDIGSTFFLHYPEDQLFMVRDYEREAGLIGMANLRYILVSYDFPPDFRRNYLRLFNDYLHTDLEYIITYYRTGQVKNFFNKWHYDSPRVPPIALNFPITLRRRNNKPLALLNVR